MIPLEHFLVLSALLFGIGFYGVLARRSAILILISVEIMLAAVAIMIVAACWFFWIASSEHDPSGAHRTERGDTDPRNRRERTAI